MKKFLFIGALLITGSLAFGGVATTLESKGTSGTFTGTDLHGEASLKLTSRGSIIDSTGKATLILTPTVNMGADGESLSFDFASMIIDQPQTLVGKFTAKVVTAGNPSGVEELPFGNATVTTTLSKIASATDGSVSGNSLIGLTLSDVETGDDIGDLTYQVAMSKTNSTTYTGEVTATATPKGEGSFINKDGMVTVKVENFTYQGAGSI